MRYYKLAGSDGEPRLAIEAEDGALTDLTTIDVDVTDIEDLALASSLRRIGFDEVVVGLIPSSPPKDYGLAQIIEESREWTGDLWLDRPIEPPEVWAAGVTYRTSEMERRRESETPDICSGVYVAERPEPFLNATSNRCVGLTLREGDVVTISIDGIGTLVNDVMVV